MTTTYRADIDGLRAVAILPVVLYHASFPGFSGGFIGVDVFFVISGYLITSIIYSEIDRGSFSLLSFYERRARRILPALLTVVFVTFIVGSLVLLPSDFESLSESAVASTLFASNIYFSITNDYFSSAAELLPLLHTWSLAVEEQFYIFFPLLLMSLRLSRKNILLPVIGIVFVLSLVLSANWVENKPTAAFYLLPARAWELAVGCYLAVGKLPPQNDWRLREASATVAVLLIAVPVNIYSSGTPFPGIAALAPCIGTALIIYSGMHGSTWVSRLLSCRPIVWFGLISYSLYLWHWPILAFLRNYYSKIDIGLEAATVALFLSIGVAALSHHFIEAPFRRRSFLSRARIFSIAALAMMLITVSGLIGWVTDGATFRFDSTTLALEQGAADIDPRRKECSGIRPGNDLCRIGRISSGPPTFLFWGDSHAAALMPAISMAAERAGQTGLFVGAMACPPLVGAWNLKLANGRDCRELNDAVIGYLKSVGDEIVLVIVASRWALYATGARPHGESGGAFLIVDDLTNQPSISENAYVFERGLNRTVTALLGSDKSVVMLGGVPEIGWHVPSVLAKQNLGRLQGFNPPSIFDHRARNILVDKIAGQLSDTTNLRYIQIADIICDDVCRVVHDGKPVYSDDDHLSLHGAVNLVGPRLAERIWPAP